MLEFVCGFFLGVVVTVASGIAWLYAVMQGHT